MNIRTLCLAILASRDATGYEIRKLSLDGKYSHFVDASYGAIYPALNRLEQDGLVTCREESQPGKPPRKVYSITEAGRTELIEALSIPPGKDIFRSPFLLIAVCAEMLPRDVIETAIATREAQLEEEMAIIRAFLKDGNHAGTKWVYEYGMKCVDTSLTHLRSTKASLLALSKSNQTESVAVEAAE